jgi:hypothetical protein
MTVRVCIKCKLEKNIEDFAKDSRCSSGRRGKCKKCHTEYMIEYYKKNKDKRDAKNKMNTKYVAPWKRHHITEEKFETMLNLFNGKCHVCREKEATSIDHDHSCCSKNRSCGKCVRGILCRGCNTALGSLKENPDTISRLLIYIKPR